MSAVVLPRRPGLAGRLSDLLWRRPNLLVVLLLAPPVLWLGLVYLGSLAALLVQSFYSLDDFSGVIVEEFTLSTYAALLQPANFAIILRTVVMAAAVTLAIKSIGIQTETSRNFTVVEK